MSAVAQAQASTLPVISAPTGCSNTTVGKLPCTWTSGINAYPGDSDAFSHKNTDSIIKGLVKTDGLNTVVINVPISAGNFTDAHVEMPKAGKHETYNCAPSGKSANEFYYSPSSKEIIAMGRTALRANKHAVVVIRPMLALGGSCNPTDYYPNGKFFGSGYPKGRSNESAFGHFYTGILLRLADDAVKINTQNHVVLDDATGMDCLFDDPSNAGYIHYFATLPGQIHAKHPGLPQMYTLDSNFTASSINSCGWPNTFKHNKKYNEAQRDHSFLAKVGMVGINENMSLNPSGTHHVNTAAGIYKLWASARAPVAGTSRSLTAAGMVAYLHNQVGTDVVLSSIGYTDCGENPVHNPGHIPSGCNRVLSKSRQAQPTRSGVAAQQHAVQAAYCYWTQAEGSAEPWFRGLWWWNRDFDATPYVDSYNLTWGSNNLGTAELAQVKTWSRGNGSCTGVIPVTPPPTTGT